MWRAYERSSPPKILFGNPQFPLARGSVLRDTGSAWAKKGQFGTIFGRPKPKWPRSEQNVDENPEGTSSGESDTSNEVAGGASGAWDDLEFGFIGNPTTKLDDRGRLKMPAEFKAFIDKKYGKDFKAFYITSREGKDAEIYPMPEWRLHHAKVLQMPRSLPARKILLAMYNLYGGRVDMDPQGRLLFPDELRSKGMVDVEVKVSGEGGLLRVTPLNTLREIVSTNPITSQIEDSWASYGV
jgi:MraZ protein